MPDVLRAEPPVGLVDVVRVGGRLAEDDRDEVLAERRLDRAAGRGRRDEVERAAEPHARPWRGRTSSSRACRSTTRSSRTLRRGRRGRRGASTSFTAGQSTGCAGATFRGMAIVRGRGRTGETRTLCPARRPVGLNLQPGQLLGINAFVEHAPLARAIAREAYAQGARYVDVLYADQHVRTRAHRARRRTPMLGHTPPWLVERMTQIGELGGALCAISGNPEPELFADLDGERVGKSRMRELAEASLKLTDGLCNWTIVAYPNEGWAHDRLRRARRRAPLGRRRDGGPPRRARPGRGVA